MPPMILRTQSQLQYQQRMEGRMAASRLEQGAKEAVSGFGPPYGTLKSYKHETKPVDASDGNLAETNESFDAHNGLAYGGALRYSHSIRTRRHYGEG
jgi:hypothetical protein